MDTYREVIQTIATIATNTAKVGPREAEHYMDFVAMDMVETARDVTRRNGAFQVTVTEEARERIEFYGLVASDILDGTIERPAVGNVRDHAMILLR